MKSAASLCGGC